MTSKARCECHILFGRVFSHCFEFDLLIHMYNCACEGVRADLSLWARGRNKQLKYFRATFSKDDSCTTNIQVGDSNSGNARLSKIWSSHSIKFTTNYNVFQSLVVTAGFTDVKRGLANT